MSEYNHLSGHEGHILGVTYSPDRELIATASKVNSSRLSTGFKSMKFSATGELVTATENGMLTLWNLEKILALNEWNTPALG
ncbi:MAG: hypothetical protein AAF722_15995 [Cyanobacteria bacterium P01_C01_bin.70]